jgi:hypothetical protein
MVLKNIIRKRHEVFLQKRKNQPNPKVRNSNNQQNQQQYQQQNPQQEQPNRASQYEDHYGFEDEKDEKAFESNVEEEGEEKREFMINNVVLKVNHLKNQSNGKVRL